MTYTSLNPNHSSKATPPDLHIAFQCLRGHEFASLHLIDSTFLASRILLREIASSSTLVKNRDACSRSKEAHKLEESPENLVQTSTIRFTDGTLLAISRWIDLLSTAQWVGESKHPCWSCTFSTIPWNSDRCQHMLMSTFSQGTVTLRQLPAQLCSLLQITIGNYWARFHVWRFGVYLEYPVLCSTGNTSVHHDFPVSHQVCYITPQLPCECTFPHILTRSTASPRIWQLQIKYIFPASSQYLV